MLERRPIVTEHEFAVYTVTKITKYMTGTFVEGDPKATKRKQYPLSIFIDKTSYDKIIEIRCFLTYLGVLTKLTLSG